MIRIAAVGDVHVGEDSDGRFEPWIESVHAEADVLLLAGDLTRSGRPTEAARLARELVKIRIPVVAVLGNHDYQMDQNGEITDLLRQVRVRVLEGDATTLRIGSLRLGVAGTKGFGGGFMGACGSDFGEPEMKAFIRHTKRLAEALRVQLASLEADIKVALLHYAPVPDTLEGERREIYPFLGSYLLGEAVDASGATFVVHGHAHAGREVGSTPGGIPVRNVARTVIRRPYKIYRVGVDSAVDDDAGAFEHADVTNSRPTRAL
jgi:Icc-related predicted phosphoesterase